MNSHESMEKATCKSPPKTNESTSKQNLGLDLKSKENEVVEDGCSSPSCRTSSFSNLDCRKRSCSEEPPVADKPLPLTQSLSSENIFKSCISDGHSDGQVVVGVRVRPFTSRELDEADVHCVLSMEGNETMVTVGNGEVCRFMYDYSFWSFDPTSANYADQAQVYEDLAKPLLGKVFEGYNTCLFAYGQTGSGKSYSVMGHGTDVGIIPRFCEDLFTRIYENDNSNIKFNVQLSIYEIYNEKIHDLLTSSATKDKSNKKICLKVREHPVLGPYVEGLSSYVVKSFEDVNTWITLGNKRRATAATGVNDNSSRSHSVVALLLTQTRTDDIEGESLEHNITSRINMVDLAGSERQSQAKTSGERLREGASINCSLVTLGRVISALAENSVQVNKKKRLFIPYRESILTWLLRESLGGNSKTAMLTTISPSSNQIEETLSSLRYAKQARYIINSARINEDAKTKLVRASSTDLRYEIGTLGYQAEVTDNNDLQISQEEGRRLREQLLTKEKEMAELTRELLTKMALEETLKNEKKLLLDQITELKSENSLAKNSCQKLENQVDLFEQEKKELEKKLHLAVESSKNVQGQNDELCSKLSEAEENFVKKSSELKFESLTNASLRQDLNSAENQIKSLNRLVQVSEQSHAELKVEFEACKGQNKELELRKNQLKNKLIVSRKKVTSLEEIISMLQNRCSQMEDERDRMKEAVEIENQKAESCEERPKEELVAAKDQRQDGQVKLKPSSVTKFRSCCSQSSGERKLKPVKAPLGSLNAPADLNLLVDLNEPIDLTADDDECFEPQDPNRMKCSVCSSFESSDHWRYHQITRKLTCTACYLYFQVHGVDRPTNLWGKPIQRRRRRYQGRTQSTYN